MIQDERVIRLEYYGPSEMKCDPADFQSPLPTEHLHVCFEDKVLEMSVGVWETSTMQEAFGPYPGDEFIRVLKGEVTITEEDGTSHTLRADDCFVIPKATVGSWLNPERVKKHYAILDAG